jgi:acyl-CoA synthetase (AMP-forming)/AMP-acid ligase II
MNVSMILEMAASGYGDRLIVGTRSAGMSVDQLQELALARAGDVLESQADAVVYLGINGPAFPVALFAAAYAGVPLVPLNYRLGAEQLARLIDHHSGAVAVADPDLQAPLLGAVKRVFTVDEWLTPGGSPATVDEASDAARPAAIIYTSGTTSEPKGVILRHENLTSYVLSTVDFGSADEQEAALMSVPPYHIAALANVLTNLYAGRRFLVLEKFAAADWVRLAAAEGVTQAMVVPTMLARILDAPTSLDLPALATLSYGGAPMPSSVIEKALGTWPSVNFVNAYGLTETSSTISVLTPEDHRTALASDLPELRARLGSAGQILPSVEVQIRDDKGVSVPPGTKGRIWVRGAQVSGEYVGSGKVTDADGYFDTRDEGHVDADGYLFIGGRSDDTIIRGAENIAPAEIEDVLLRHAAVQDAVVVGLPDEEWGQRLVAVTVLRPGGGATEAELQDFVRSVLRSSKTPDRFYFWPDLPRTDTGKLLRRAVVEELSAD